MLAFAAALVVFAQSESPLSIGAGVAFKALDLSRKEVSSNVFRGKRTALFLWGPWSGQSSRSLEIAQGMRERFGGEVNIAALSTWDSLENTQAFVNENPNLHITFLWDPAGKDTAHSLAVTVFKTRRFPSVFVLDGNGKLLGSFIGFKPSDDIAGLLAR